MHTARLLTRLCSEQTKYISFRWTNTHPLNALCVCMQCILCTLNATNNFYMKGTLQMRALVHSFCVAFHCTLWLSYFNLRNSMILPFHFYIHVVHIYCLLLLLQLKQKKNLFRCCMILCCWLLVFDQRVPFLLFLYFFPTLSLYAGSDRINMLSQVIKPLFVNVNNAFLFFIYVRTETNCAYKIYK